MTSEAKVLDGGCTCRQVRYRLSSKPLTDSKFNRIWRSMAWVLGA